MKITFIYAYEPGETWSTPMALINEFKKRDWETDIISIGSNRTGQYHDRDLQKWIESDDKTDIVLFMDWGRFDSQWLDKKYKPDAFWIQESGDDPQNWERNSPKANRFHLTITPDHDSYLAYKNLGINAEWITHFADTAVQFPMNIPTEYIAVTTRGIGNSNFLDHLTQWSEGLIGNRNGLDEKQHTEFLNKGLMVIQNSRWGEITRRIFEAMACGKMVITDRLNASKKLHELFIDGEEIVFYDNMVDCIEKINYYNENKERRDDIANRGMQKVLKNFTQTQIVDRLIKNYKQRKKNKFSITLPTLWKSEFLMDMLKKYDECEYVDEIIIVDNAYDINRDLSHIKKLVHIKEPQNTFVIPAYNKLVKTAKNDLIILSSDDIFFDVDDYLKIINEVHNNYGLENIGIIGAHCDNFEENTIRNPSIESYNPKDNKFGWGVLICFHKSNWIQIPEQLKIYYADNFMQMMMPHKIYQMRKFPIKTKMSTSADVNISWVKEITDNDTIEWYKLLNELYVKQILYVKQTTN